MYCSVFTLHYSPNTLSFPALRSSGGASTVPVRELPRSGKSSSGVDLGGGGAPLHELVLTVQNRPVCEAEGHPRSRLSAKWSALDQ